MVKRIKDNYVKRFQYTFVLMIYIIPHLSVHIVKRTIVQLIMYKFLSKLKQRRKRKKKE